MKTDLYTKVVLTIIAVCLTYNVLKDVSIIPVLNADNTATPLTVNTLPRGLKTNEDGSLNVRLASSVMEVKPAYGAEFNVKPTSSAEFKVKPASYTRFTVEPYSSAEFKVKTSSSSPLYITPSSNSVFKVDNVGKPSANNLLSQTVNTYAYPNPAKDRVIINYSITSSNEYLTICNMEGKVLDYKLLDPSVNEIEIDLFSYSSGVYIYSIGGTGGKIIVKK